VAGGRSDCDAPSLDPPLKPANLVDGFAGPTEQQDSVRIRPLPLSWDVVRPEQRVLVDIHHDIEGLNLADGVETTLLSRQEHESVGIEAGQPLAQLVDRQPLERPRNIDRCLAIFSMS
jgi:hypothetical protein